MKEEEGGEEEEKEEEWEEGDEGEAEEGPEGGGEEIEAQDVLSTLKTNLFTFLSVFQSPSQMVLSQ